VRRVVESWVAIQAPPGEVRLVALGARLEQAALAARSLVARVVKRLAEQAAKRQTEQVELQAVQGGQ